MTTAKEIRDMFLANVMKDDRRKRTIPWEIRKNPTLSNFIKGGTFDIEQDFDYVSEISTKKQTNEEAIKNPKVHRDRTKSVSITDICVFTCMCPRMTYYGKVVGRPLSPETLLRMNMGHEVHEIPINPDGYEVAFEYDGINCRMDDIDPINGWIADKKTTASKYNTVKEYPEKQLNMYRVVAEDNTQMPFKVKNLFVVNINSTTGKVAVLDVPIWDKQVTIDFMNSTRTIILEHTTNRKLPNAKGSWWCDQCQYTDLCEVNLNMDPSSVDEHIIADEPDEVNGD